VAEEFAMIDVISGGRLIAGFPVGSPMDTCFAYGQNPSMLRERYLEAHDLVVKAWTEPDTFALNGRYNQQRYVNIWPRPVQKPRPPIWIPGGGSVETWRWCAQMDHVYCYLSYYGYKAGQSTMDGFWAEMDRLGKDRNPYHAGFLQFVGVAETREKAYELYREPAEYFYGRCLHIDPRFAGPPGYTTEETQRRGIQGQVQQAAAQSQRYETKFSTLAREMDAIVDKGLRDHRLARRGRRAVEGGGAQTQCRPPDDAFAVRQHEQGSGEVQHQALRRAGHAAIEGRLCRVARPLVAAADGASRMRRADTLPAGRNGGRVGVPITSLQIIFPLPPPAAGEGRVRGPCGSPSTHPASAPPRPPSPAVRERGFSQHG
jgi:alkanesulfonate monooxygenase SsuD/methylene tetrahydromethanopterin reductase-like flavin-dependent oxidoreductase (luciferase family)